LERIFLVQTIINVFNLYLLIMSINISKIVVIIFLMR